MQGYRPSRLLYRLTLMSSLAGVCALGAALLAPAVEPAAPGHHALAARAAGHAAAHGRAPVTVIFWNGDWATHEYPWFQRVIDRFNKSHPGIFVKQLPIASNDTKLLASITAGDVPDLAEMQSTNVGSWAFRGALADLDPYIKSTHFDLSSVIPAVVAEGTLHGKLYALGNLFDGSFLYWNKDQFKAAGLDPNAPPKTIAQFDALNNKLTVQNKNGTFKSVGFFPQMSGGGLFTWGNVFGGSFYNDQTHKVTMNDPRIVQALTWETSYFKRYGASNVSRFASSSFGTGPMAGVAFGFKLSAMDINGEYMADNYYSHFAKDLRYGTAPMPVLHAGDQPKSVVYPNATVIPAGSKHPKEAWEFMAYLLNPDNTAFVANQVDNMPQATALYASDAGINKIKFASLRNFMRIFRGDKAFYFPTTENSNYLSNQVALAEGNATLGKMSPKQALDQATMNGQNDLNKVTGGH